MAFIGRNALNLCGGRLSDSFGFFGPLDLGRVGTGNAAMVAMACDGLVM